MNDREWLKKIKIKIVKLSPRKADVCVVVASYNSVERITRFISIMKTQTYKPDILVVDNSSNRNVINALKSVDINILSVEGLNVGTAGAFFIGQVLAMYMGYEWIINSDDDAYPSSSQFVEKLIGGTKKAKALVGFGYQKKYGGLVEDDCLGCTAQLALINCTVFEKIGFFEPKIWKIMEDIEYRIRIERYGIKTVCVREAAYNHPISGQWSYGWPMKFLYYSFRNFLFVKQLYLKNMVGLFAFISTVIYASISNYKLLKWYVKAFVDFLCSNYYFVDYDFPAELRYPSILEKRKILDDERLNFVTLMGEKPLYLKNKPQLVPSSLITSINKDVVFASGNFFNNLFLLFRSVYVYDCEMDELYLIRKRTSTLRDYAVFIITVVISTFVFALFSAYLLLSHFLFRKNAANQQKQIKELSRYVLEQITTRSLVRR